MSPARINTRRSASLSRDIPSDAPPPRLSHSLHEEHSSVLSLSVDDEHIFSGSQYNEISVWDKQAFTLKTTLKGHTGSVLALEYAEDKKWLFSSSGDSTVRIWSTTTLTPLYILNPYLETGSGDLFSLVWSSALQTIYIGCQNTSLQWFDFSQLPLDASSLSSTLNANTTSIPPSGSGTTTPSRAAHKFFDSYPQYERRPADLFAANGADGCVQLDGAPPPRASLQVATGSVIDSAHWGYIYCMALLQGQREDGKMYLLTGSGDETVKLWDCTPTGPTLVHTFECCHGAVLSLVARGDTVYAGCQEGYVKVWDLETRTLVRTIIVQENVDILSLSLMDSDLYTCSANGQIQRWSSSFDCTASWSAHNGIVLSSIIAGFTPSNSTSVEKINGRIKNSKSSYVLISGGNDDYIKIWEVTPPQSREHISQLIEIRDDGDLNLDDSCDTLVHALSTFVSIPSVSGLPARREDCRQAAIWLKKCLAQLGATSSLLPTGEDTNPLVLATFHGTQGKHHKPRILFYGHYDVIAAPPALWSSDPFTLTGRNGYLYGRGVTDNKGPVLAVACAAAALLGRRALEVDLVLLIEGEEERGSVGFGATVRKHKSQIGHIDAILMSNSTWISEHPPCITYGMRGVVHCTVDISNSGPDLHSGVEGGAAAEPMVDMIQLLGTLTDSQRRVTIPGFYRDVRPQTPSERALYTRLASIAQLPADSLSARWREPALTIHSVEVSGPKNSTVIPASASAQVSLRIVPDQDLDTVSEALCAHIRAEFARMGGPNQLDVRVDHTADWWLGDLEGAWSQALERAVAEEWGIEPLRIREGGSIPSVPFLEKVFGCHALHLPLGQSSDQAHLPNERISLANLRRGGRVIERFLLSVPALGVAVEGSK